MKNGKIMKKKLIHSSMDPVEKRIERAAKEIEAILDREKLGMVPHMEPSIRFIDGYKSGIITSKDMEDLGKI